MPLYNSKSLNTQNDLLLQNLMVFYKETSNINKFIKTVNGDTNISLRIIDWFVTNYAKKYYTIYEIEKLGAIRFKVYNDYKLKLKAYSKKRFDPFCRWKRIQMPYNDTQNIETTIGQLNFFKWAIENDIIEYIHEHYSEIESDMNARNTVSKKRNYTERSTSSISSTEDEISDEQKLDNLIHEQDESSDARMARDVVNEIKVSDIKPLDTNNKTRKRREELSISACKCIKKETVKILVKFS
jgi:hypothetical protein